MNENAPTKKILDFFEMLSFISITFALRNRLEEQLSAQFIEISKVMKKCREIVSVQRCIFNFNIIQAVLVHFLKNYCGM